MSALGDGRLVLRLGALQLRLRGLQLGLRGGDLGAGILTRFARDHQGIDIGAATCLGAAHLDIGAACRHFGTAHIQLGATGGDGGFGLLQRERIAGRIDFHQQVAFLDQLVVAHRQLHHLPGDIRGDIDHVGTHAAIARPGREHVVLPQAPGQQDGQQEDGRSDEETENRFDRHDELLLNVALSFRGDVAWAGSGRQR